MKFAALLHKFNINNPTVIPAQTALDLATVNGAKALGLENQIGSLEIGKKADMIILNLKTPHLIPISSRESIISHLVYSVTGNDVETVIVEGKIIMKDKRILTVDEEKIYKDANKLIQTLLE
jgi:5-methylthioadenosine/S-adenosylhomocysteine deaminase